MPTLRSSTSGGVRTTTHWCLSAALVVASLSLGACDKLGLGGPQQDPRREAEGRAIGGGCRHAGRAIEDCFAQNRQADKAAVFAGWREMNDYMMKQAVPAPNGGGDAKGGKTASSDGRSAESAAASASGAGN